MVQNANRPILACQVAFNADPNDPAVPPVWTELAPANASLAASNPVLALATKRGRQYELDQNQAGTASVTVENANEWLSAGNTSSPYYPDVVPFRQFRAYAAWPLTGNILNVSNGYDPTVVTGAGGWVGAAASATHVRSGANAASVTWPTGGSGAFGVYLPISHLQPGRRYAFSFYVYVPSGGSPPVVTIDFGTGSTLVSSSTSAVTNAFTRLVHVFDATADTHFMGLLTAGASTAGQQMWIDDYQLDYGGTASTFTATGPVFYPLHTGYIERWPSAWTDAGSRGQSDMTSVDATTVLSNQTLGTEYVTTLRAMAPDYYWPMQEPSEATSFAELSGNGGPPLVYMASKYGAGTVTAGQQSTVRGDVGGSYVAINDAAPSPTYAGSGLQTGLPGTQTQGIDVGADSGAWAVSVAFLYKAPVSHGAVSRRVIVNLLGRSRFGFEKHALAVCDGAPGTGFVFAELLEGTDAAGSGISAVATPVFSMYGPADFAVAVTVNVTAGGSATVEFHSNGSLGASTTTAIGTTPQMRCTQVEVGANLANLLGNASIGMSIAHLAVWRRVITAAEIAALVDGGAGWQHESSGGRVTRYLAHGFTGASSVDTGQSTRMGTSTLTSGTTMLDALQQTAVSENGNLFVDGGGVVQFRDRASRYLSLTSSFTFGDGAGELPYETDIAYDFDAAQVFNDVTVVRPGGSSPHVADAASQLRYFPRSLSRTHNVWTDNEAADAAAYFLQKSKDPALRISRLTLNPAANPNLWPAALGCEIGTRVTVNRRPRAGVVLAGDYFVESVEHTVAPDSWLTSFGLSPASPTNVWVLQDATFGQLDVSTRLAY
jgi:hypothetical protein